MTVLIDTDERVLQVAANFALPDRTPLPKTLHEIFGPACRDRIVARTGQNTADEFSVSLASKRLPSLHVCLLPPMKAELPHWEIVLQACKPSTNSFSEHFSVLEKAADDAGDGLIVTDCRGLIEHFSRGSTALFGYEEKELIGQNISFLMPEPYRSRHAQYVMTHQATGKGRILGIGPRELPILRKNGETSPIELSVSETWLHGERKYIGICRDISSRMKREEVLLQTKQTLAENLRTLENANLALQQRQEEISFLAESLEKARDEAINANAAKSDFLATLSHEIRTPLNGIIGMSQILAGSALDGTQLEQLDVIMQSASTLMDLLNDLLDLSKIEAGQMRFEAQPVDAYTFIGAIAEQWRRRARIKSLPLHFSPAGLSGVSITIDPLRMAQLLNNLLSNAVKFTEQGEVSLVAALSRDEQQGTVLRVEVADTGIGISESQQAKLFNPFVQADASTTRRYGGTGLGLAICKRIVGLMGGQIGMQSVSGKGSRFHFSIPVICAASQPMVERRKTDQSPPDGTAPLHILVAEDNKINQKVIGAILGSLGHSVEFADDGLHAINLLSSSQFDLALMDLRMPNMDGLAATRAIRARTDAIGQIPIIGLTASATQQDREDCTSAGMTDFVPKPVIIDALKKALQNVRRADDC